jgi:hypothetical protein
VENNQGEIEIKWVLEIGFAESYDKLVDDVTLWLGGRSDVSVAVLVKFEEDPPYRCPVSPTDEDDLASLKIPLVTKEMKISDFVCEEFGPVTYREKTWVGRISAVYMEVWKRGPNGPERQGDRVDLTRPDGPPIQIQLGDFLPIPQGHDGMVSLELKDFHKHLRIAMKRLAFSRCSSMVKELRKRLGERSSDRDYQDSQMSDGSA